MNLVQVQNVSLDELSKLLEDIVGRKIESLISTFLLNDRDNNDLLTRNEAADYLNISLPTLSKHIKSGRLKTKRLGRRVYILKQSIDDALTTASPSNGGTL